MGNYERIGGKSLNHLLGDAGDFRIFGGEKHPAKGGMDRKLESILQSLIYYEKLNFLNADYVRCLVVDHPADW